MTGDDKNFNTRNAGLVPTVKALFDDADITLEPSSKALTGLRGKTIIDGLAITVHLMPLRKTRYGGQHRIGASTVGYRLTIEINCDVPIRFSVVHQGIRGSKLIAWMNNIKRITRVPNNLLDLHQYQAWCNDAGWANSFLNRTEANVAITNLLKYPPNDANIGSPCVFISPTNIQYFRRATSIERFDTLSEHVRDVATLYRTAIEIAPPTKPRQASYMEKLFKKKPLLAGGLTLASMFLLLILTLLIMLSLIGGLIWLISLLQ